MNGWTIWFRDATIPRSFGQDDSIEFQAMKNTYAVMLCRSCLNTWICIRRIFIANILHIFVLKVQATFTGFSGDVPFGPLQLVFTAGYCARTFCCNRIRTHETMPSQYKSFLGRGVPSCIHFQAHAIVYFTYYIYICILFIYRYIYTYIII